MKEIVQKIISTEEEASRLVRQARDEAGRILSGADEETNRIMARARAEAQSEGEKILQQSLQQAAAERQRLVEEARRRGEEFSRPAPAVRERAASLIFEELTRT